MKNSHLIPIVILNVLFTVSGYSQIEPLLNVTYQEGITKVISQTIDDYGNTYHAGIFKAALVVDGDTLAYGQGGFDYFILKRSFDGTVQWAIPFGSASDDNRNLYVTSMGDNIMLHGQFTQQITFKDKVINLLYENQDNFLTIKLDSSGNDKWIKRSTIPFKSFQQNSSGLIWGITNDYVNVVDAKIENNTLYNFNGQKATLIIAISDNGEFSLAAKLTNKYGKNGSLNIFIRNNTKNNSIFFLVEVFNYVEKTGSIFLDFNNNLIPTTEGISKYLIKTDTLFKVLAFKQINPLGNSYFTGSDPENQIVFSSDSSSIHLLLNNNLYGAFSVDNYNLSLFEKSGIAIFDSNLNFKETKMFFENQKYVFVDRIQEYKNNFYVFGKLQSNIGHAMGEILPGNNVEIKLTPNKSIDFDLNGLSKGFFMKLDTNRNYLNHTFIGDFGIQESFDLNVNGITFKDSYCHFFQLMDNRFNPWKLDLNLTLKYGGSKKLSDGPDYINFVEYFDDNKKLAIGESKGFNAFDKDSSGIINSYLRNDFFYALLDSSDVPIKYFRLKTSFVSCTVMKTKKINNKVYCLVNVTSGSNAVGYNYFKLNNQIVNVPEAMCRLLLTIDSAGSLTYRRVDNLSFGSLIDFDAYENGDLLLLAETSTNALVHNGKNFQSSLGNYIVRTNPEFQILKAIKIVKVQPLFPRFTSIHAIPNTDEFFFWGTEGFPPNSGSSIAIQVDRGNGIVSSLFSTNPTGNSSSYLHYGFLGKVSFSSNGYFSSIGPFEIPLPPKMVTLDSRAVLLLSLTNTQNHNLYFKNQVLAAAPYEAQNLMIGLTGNGELYRKSTIHSISPDYFPVLNTVRFKLVKDKLFIIGSYSKSLKFGALNLVNKGDADGVVIKLDTLFNYVQFYNVSSPFYDYCSDVDVSKDSSLLIAYHSQGTPAVKIGLTQQPNTGILPKDMEPSGWLSRIPASAIPRDYMYSIKQGDWHDATIWSTGKVPVSQDRVFVRHKVQISQSSECFQLLVDPNADFKVNNGALLKIYGGPAQNL